MFLDFCGDFLRHSAAAEDENSPKVMVSMSHLQQHAGAAADAHESAPHQNGEIRQRQPRNITASEIAESGYKCQGAAKPEQQMRDHRGQSPSPAKAIHLHN